MLGPDLPLGVILLTIFVKVHKDWGMCVKTTMKVILIIMTLRSLEDADVFCLCVAGWSQLGKGLGKVFVFDKWDGLNLKRLSAL